VKELKFNDLNQRRELKKKTGFQKDKQIFFTKIQVLILRRLAGLLQELAYF